VLALLTATGAGAQGVAFALFDGWETEASLHHLDLETGALIRIGPVGRPCTNIDFDAAGALYGIDPVNSQLILIDAMTASSSPIGALGGSIAEVTGLTFDTAGRLWMAARDDALGPSLFEVDRDTGAAVWVSAVDEAYFGALASTGGTVFTASDILATMDTTTGVVTPVPGSDLGIWWTRALDFDDLGTLRGLLLCGPCAAPWDVLIVNPIDFNTGTLTGDSLFASHGTWGLAILHGGIFLDGFESGDLTAWSAGTGALSQIVSVD